MFKFFGKVADAVGAFQRTQEAQEDAARLQMGIAIGTLAVPVVILLGGIVGQRMRRMISEIAEAQVGVQLTEALKVGGWGRAVMQDEIARYDQGIADAQGDADSGARDKFRSEAHQMMREALDYMRDAKAKEAGTISPEFPKAPIGPGKDDGVRVGPFSWTLPAIGVSVGANDDVEAWRIPVHVSLVPPKFKGFDERGNPVFEVSVRAHAERPKRLDGVLVSEGGFGAAHAPDPSPIAG